MTKRTIGGAVIGYGGMGNFHSEKMQTVDGIELIGVYDIDPKQNELAKSRGIHAYASREELLADPDIIRNRLKIRACVTNSRVFMEIQREYGSFDKYIWSFTGGKPIVESCDLRSSSPLSDEISKDLKKRGMKFVGSTIVYAYLQAVGILSAHESCCDCRAGK